MNDLTLYEKIPESSFPIRIFDYKDSTYAFALHWHEHTEIHFIFEGEGKLRCGDEMICLQSGDCVIVNGNELHQGLQGHCSYGCLILSPSFFDGSHTVFQRVTRDRKLADYFGNIFESYRRQAPGCRHEIKGYTNLLVAYLTLHYAKETLSENLYHHRMQKLDRINSAVQYIHENFTEKITTAQLAGIVHLSEGHFCNLFKEAIGISAMAYVNELRIKKAYDLIQLTDMTITEVAMCSGFSDANYFTRMFKKATGKTPFSIKRGSL